MRKSKRYSFFMVAGAAFFIVAFEILRFRGEAAVPAGSGYTIIDVAAADSLIEQKEVVVVDARSAEMYREGHIKKAISLPLEEVEQEIYKIADGKDRTLLLYCRNQARSTKAASILHNLGFSRLFVLAGGFSKWQSENRPVEKARE